PRLLRRLPRDLRPHARPPRLRGQRDAAVRPDRHGDRPDRHVRSAGLEHLGREPRARARDLAAVHAVRRDPGLGVHERRVALRSADQGARVRLRDPGSFARRAGPERGQRRGAGVRYRRRASSRKSHGALWSIIYIDLMTQIMAFFVIVWSVEHGTKLTATPQLGVGTGVGMGDQTVRMVDLPGDVLFSSGQTQMATDGKAILDKL